MLYFLLGNSNPQRQRGKKTLLFAQTEMDWGSDCLHTCVRMSHVAAAWSIEVRRVSNAIFALKIFQW